MATHHQESELKGAHILIIPYPAQGHLLPLLDLAHLLSFSNDVAAITIAVTTLNLPILSPLLSSSSPASIRTLPLKFPNYPSIPPGVENAKDLHPATSSFITLMHALSFVQPQIVDWARSTPNPPTAIISDFFCGWTHHLARELSIPRITFSPSGALCLCIMNSLWTEMPPKSETVRFESLPNSPVYEWGQLSSTYRAYVEGDPVSEFVKDGFRANIESSGFVINTFDDLEGVYLTQMKKDLGHDRVWGVGPLNLVGTSRGGPHSSADDLLTWLDGQEVGSAVYVCFGTQAVLSAEQAEALASGLERSGARFVWSFRGPTGVPDGAFEERTKERGRVVRGWVPQVELLNHPSVGFFLTHCGWNSVLEGISAGVAMLTWPMKADQFYNARLLEEEAKIGVRVCEGRETVPDPEELGRLVAEAVSGNGEERARARELQAKAAAAVREGGSSYRDVTELVQMLSKREI